MYCSLNDARDWVAYGDSSDDGELQAALDAAERSIDLYCGQRFEPDSTATARTFWAYCSDVVDLAAQHSVIGDTTGMIVAGDEAGDGTYAKVWSAADWDTDPENGIGPDGRAGWPITRLRAIGSLGFPSGGRRRGVRVTAKWGWAQTPSNVSLACRMLTVAWHHRRATVAGQGGFEDFFRSAITDDQTVRDLLDPFRHGLSVTGFA